MIQQTAEDPWVPEEEWQYCTYAERGTEEATHAVEEAGNKGGQKASALCALLAL